MKLVSVFDPSFASYGRVVTGLEESCKHIVEALEKTPLPEGVAYVAEEPILQCLPEVQVISDHCYGGMPVELGWCNGHNTKLNCLEYHRDSEYNLGSENFVLLVARMDDMVDGMLHTDKIKAFWAPAGVLVEVYSTTMHYAPCHMDPNKGFRVMIALPMGTNFEKPQIEVKTPEDELLWARNKWLLAHPDSSEAASGAPIRIEGVNIDIAADL